MKKVKLHQWLLILLTAATIYSCSKKNFLSKNTDEVTAAETVNNYTPPPVIIITDDKAKSNKDGELYYDNEFGYRYWRYCDGKYYLDAKYESGARPSKKDVDRRKTKKVKKEDTEAFTRTN
jgi:hypothetical protein